MVLKATPIEGDDIEKQIAQLPEEVAHWERQGDYMVLLDDKTGAVKEKRLSPDKSLVETVAPAVIAYFVPVIGAEIASALGTSTAVGTAIAQTAVSVAQGAPLDKAILNAGTNLLTQGVTGSQDAKDFIGSITSDKTTQNIITNVANSVVNTVAKGGSGSEILTNAVSAATGTAAGQSLDSQTAGQFLGTALATGSPIAATTAAAGSAGAESVKKTTPPPPEKIAFSQDLPVSSAAENVIAAVESIQPDKLAFAGPAAGIGSAAAAETAALLQRLAATPQGQAALQEAALVSTRVRDAIIATGVFGAAGGLSFLQGASVVPPKLETQPKTAQSDLVSQIPGYSPFTPTTTPAVTTAPGVADAGELTVTGTRPANIEALTGLTQTGYTPPEADTTWTAEALRVAQALNISLAEATKIANNNRVLFDYLAGGGEPTFKPADPETMRSTDLVTVSRPGADDNIVIQRETPVTFTTPEAKPASSVDPTFKPVEPAAPTFADTGTIVIAVDSTTNKALTIDSSGKISSATLSPNTVVRPGDTVKVDPATNTITSTATTPTTTPTTVTTPTTTATTTTTPTTTPTTTEDTITKPTTTTTPTTATTPTTTPATTPTTVTTPTTETGPVVTPTTPTTPTTPVTPVPPTVPPVPPVTPEPPTPPTPPTPPEPPTPPTPPVEPPEPPEPPTPPGEPPVPPKPPKPPKPPEEPPITVTPSPVKTTRTPALPTITGFKRSPLEQALTAYRPAGEIESELGLGREDVWNEASLRLKDALGL